MPRTLRAPLTCRAILAAVLTALCVGARAQEAIPPGPLARDSREARAVLARLDRAQQAQQTSLAQLSPTERDLLWLLNFEQDDMILLSGGGVAPIALGADHYAAGRFGRGFLFEQLRQNVLPPTMADVEDDWSGFTPVGGARLDSVAADTAFGRKALQLVAAAAGDGFTTRPLSVLLNLHAPWADKQVSLLASCTVKGPEGAQIKLEATFTPQDLLDDKTKQPVADRKPDVPTPQTITLTGGWQRVACWVTGDSRLTERQAILALTSLAPGPITLLADGFQFQQINYTSNPGFVPTTWVPGGERRPPTFVDLTLPAIVKAFPFHEGAVSFWTRSPNPLGAAWFGFDAGWRSDMWSLGTYVALAGKQKGERPLYTAGLLAQVSDGGWHHLTWTWDTAKGYLYQDGRLLGSVDREDTDLAPLLDSYHLRVGGDINGTSANAVLDDLAVFRRRLTDQEVAQRAAGTAPLRAAPGDLVLAPGRRTTYYRDETKAPLQIVVRSLGATKGPVTADLAVGDLLAYSKPVVLAKDQAVASFGFAPVRLKRGSYRCRVAVTAAGGASAYAEYPIVVVPALRRDQYLLSSWGRGIGSTEWLAFFHTLGLNCVDTEFSNAEALNALGREGFLYNWHCNIGGGDYSPKNREIVRREVAVIAEQLAPFPNWRGTLLNTETGPGVVPGADQRQAWFDRWAEQELGFPVPATGWKLLTPNNPNLCFFPESARPGADGVFAEFPPSVKFIKWWYNRGGAVWRVNALASQEMRKLRPDLLNWTDPMSSSGEIADLQAGSSWSYHVWPEDLIGEFETAQALAAGAGQEKEFYATLGMDYVAGDWLVVTEPDGAKKRLMPTPDDLIQQSWIVAAHLPSDGLTFWLLDGWFSGRRGLPIPWDPGAGPVYCPPGSDEALGRVLKEDLLPLGTMLQHVPNAPRPVALLLPESALWLNSGEGGWMWGIVHYINQWHSWLNRTGLPYTIVGDDVAPGALARYRAVIFPMAVYVSRTLHDELVAAARAGTQIIVDDHCRQTYPNMEHWSQKYAPPVYATPPYGEETLKHLADLRDRLRPDLDAYAVGAEGPVITNVREAGGAKYVSVINNNRQAGPYTEWTKKEWFRPYGQAQQATVHLRVPESSAVYEFVTSRQLTGPYAEGHRVVTLDLPPHAGRLLCIYPAALSRLAVTAAGPYQRGTPTTVAVTLKDREGRVVSGRQLVRATITDPSGASHDESGWYRLENGRASLPFRPALNDPPGRWKLTVVERTSGLKGECEVVVR